LVRGKEIFPIFPSGGGGKAKPGIWFSVCEEEAGLDENSRQSSLAGGGIGFILGAP